jgi:hypothetical protein
MLKKSVQQGRSSEADIRFTFHASRFTVFGSDARTKHGKRRVSARLGREGEKSDFFSILLGQPGPLRKGRSLPDSLSLCIHNIPDEGILDEKAASC